MPGHHQRKYARDAEHRRRLRTKYGISETDYEALLSEQRGLCAICGRPEQQTRNGRTKRLALDHNHTTGHVRALLCHACNTAVGLLDDDPQRARAVAEYLEGHAPSA